MKGKLKINVDIIKYDGKNKDLIIKKLKINNHTSIYFKDINTYFIIPFNKDNWFILNENQFNDMIILI